nr:winged helix-turn-helix domain-containing protein [Ruminococcus sp. AF46-10NS]
MASKTEKKNNTRSRIVSYVMNNADTSKVEISKNLNMSMPTVLSNVNELMAGGVLMETGEYASTGAEKPRVSGSIPVTAMQWVFVSLPIM